MIVLYLSPLTATGILFSRQSIIDTNPAYTDMYIKYPYDQPLDAPERTLWHRKLIQQKKFLRKLYEQWYQEFIREIPNLPNDTFIELGSGGGFFKKLEPRVLCTDILELPDNDMTFSALEMPLDDHSVGGIFMVDTLHHIPDMHRFFQEVARVLARGGKMIMIEPANTLWGRFIYKNFHHEPCDPKGGWTLPPTGPLSGANGALPWIVFERDHQIFTEQYPQLSLETISYRNPLLYLLSGGVSYRQLLPDFFYPMIKQLDHWLPRISKQFAMFELVKVVRTK
jgi:SAM-dependent methyltransferase